MMTGQEPNLTPLTPILLSGCYEHASKLIAQVAPHGTRNVRAKGLYLRLWNALRQRPQGVLPLSFIQGDVILRSLKYASSLFKCATHHLS